MTMALTKKPGAVRRGANVGSPSPNGGDIPAAMSRLLRIFREHSGSLYVPRNLELYLTPEEWDGLQHRATILRTSPANAVTSMVRWLLSGNFVCRPNERSGEVGILMRGTTPKHSLQIRLTSVEWASLYRYARNLQISDGQAVAGMIRMVLGGHVQQRRGQVNEEPDG